MAKPGGQRPHRPPRGRDRDDREDPFKETVVKINRCAKVVKGGRRFSFSALVVIGNRDGQVGYGFGKATAVPSSIEKGIKAARKGMKAISREGTTIPHEIWGRFGAAKILLMPAAKGTGVIAGAAVRAVVEAAGIKDILTKSFGSNNPINVIKATMRALEALKTRKEIERLRGVTLE